MAAALGVEKLKNVGGNAKKIGSNVKVDVDDSDLARWHDLNALQLVDLVRSI